MKTCNVQIIKQGSASLMCCVKSAAVSCVFSLFKSLFVRHGLDEVAAKVKDNEFVLAYILSVNYFKMHV